MDKICDPHRTSLLHRARKGLGATYAMSAMRPPLHWVGEVRERGNSPSIYRFGFYLNLRLEVGGTYRCEASAVWKLSNVEVSISRNHTSQLYMTSVLPQQACAYSYGDLQVRTIERELD